MDGIWDYLIYGSTITDYFELSFYKKTHKEKRTYATWRHSKRLIQKADPQERLQWWRSKSNMYQAMQAFVKREQLFMPSCTYTGFCAFVEKHPQFLYKPDVESCGRGVELYDVEGQDLESLFQRLTASQGVLDELIVQHPDLCRICPKSVNTLRIFTLRIEKKITLIAAALRMGNGFSIVDNYSAGGLVGAVDLKSGRILDDGEDSTGRRYRDHPYSHVRLKDFQVPNWDEVLHFVHQCAESCELNYAAWDIAVREHDCVLVEVNPTGMVNVIQIAGNGGKRELYDRLQKSFAALDK